jgi:hypothetical protein
MTVTDLKFTEVEPVENAPFATCNNCGARMRIGPPCYMANFDIDDEAHVSFILCGSECVVEFHTLRRRGFVNHYINRTIQDAARAHYRHDLDALAAFHIKHKF